MPRAPWHPGEREPVSVRPRHVYRNGEPALLIVDWSIDGTDRRGRAVHVGGTATDVARRGPDGRRRYVIDNPFGTGAQQLAAGDGGDSGDSGDVDGIGAVGNAQGTGRSGEPAV